MKISRSLARLVWNASERTGFSLGRFAPYVFGAMIGSPPKLIDAFKNSPYGAVQSPLTRSEVEKAVSGMFGTPVVTPGETAGRVFMTFKCYGSPAVVETKPGPLPADAEIFELPDGAEEKAMALFAQRFGRRD